jgi:quinol monooxygenase YgiN
MATGTTDTEKIENRNGKPIRVLAFLEAKKGQGKNLMDVVLEVVEPTRKEKGNLCYIPHYAMDNPDRILFDELWASQEDLDNHFNQPYMKELFPKMNPFLSKPVLLEKYLEVSIKNSAVEKKTMHGE